MPALIGLILIALFRGDEGAYPWVVTLGLFELLVEIGIASAVFGG